MTDLTNQEYRPGRVGGKMQLLGADINITGQDVVHDDILYKGAPVMLLLVEGLGIIQGDIGHIAENGGLLVVTGAENGILKAVGAAHNGAERLLPIGHHAVTGTGSLHSSLCPTLSQQGGIGAGNDTALGIDDAEGAACDIFQLDDYTLKYAVRHFAVLPRILHKYLFHKKMMLLYTSFAHFASGF